MTKLFLYKAQYRESNLNLIGLSYAYIISKEGYKEATCAHICFSKSEYWTISIL